MGRGVTQSSQNLCQRTETGQKSHGVIQCLRAIWGRGLPPINYGTREERNPFPLLHNEQTPALPLQQKGNSILSLSFMLSASFVAGLPHFPSCLSVLSHAVTDVLSFPSESNWRTPSLPRGYPQDLTQAWLREV